jgi:hypothetical protein
MLYYTVQINTGELWGSHCDNEPFTVAIIPNMLQRFEAQEHNADNVCGQ